MKWEEAEQRQVLEEDDSQGDYWDFVQTKGTQFMVNDLPFYINGFNTYWLMVFAVDPSTKPKISEVFQQAASVGLTVARTWAFNDGGWRALQKSPGVYDEDVFKALDFVISEAHKNNIRLILSLCNNWGAYGGKSQYVKWGLSAGLKLSSDDAFFADPTLKTYFKDHIKKVLTRVNTITDIAYKDDPTVFAWELMNEPRCTSDPSGDTLQEWITEMAIYVKSIDRKHLLEIGTEGFYGPSSPDRDGFNPNTYATQVGTDFMRNHQALGIDFASVHIYPDSWISQSVSPSHLTFVSSWIKAHIRDCDKILNMPVLFSEFGTSSRDPGYNSSYRETLIQTVYDNIMLSAKKGGAGAGSLIWQLFPEGVEYMADGYEVVLSKSPSIAKIMKAQSVSLWALSSVCQWSFKWSCRRDVINSPAFISLTADLLGGVEAAHEL
ncbi:hypothetical protein SUGI_0289040 [Cryptomeria japonica]|nr:hypothetical protein SUGI_0289040 [Cryptomeria japonica]